MNILSKVEEDVLQSILNNFTPNNENFISVTYDDFPPYTRNGVRDYLRSLKYNSLIASYSQSLSDVEIYLTPEGINYFENKKMIHFPKNSMELLKNMLEAENAVEYMQILFKDINSKSDERLRAMMKDLKEREYIKTFWGDGIPQQITFYEKAYQYEENGFSKIVADKPSTSYNVGSGNIYIKSTDNSSHVTASNFDTKELFEKMLAVTVELQTDNREMIIEAINEMEKSSGKPLFIEKYNRFIEVAANHMAVFVPFLPAVTDLLSRINI